MTLKIKSWISAVALSGVAFLGSGNVAYAYYETDPYFHEWVLSTYADFVMSVNNQFYNVNGYLAEINSYLNSGDGDNGKGVIGTMVKIWTEQQGFTEATNKNLAQMNRVTATDAAVSQRSANKMPDPRACDEMPKTLGARAASGGGGAKRGMKGRFEEVLNRNGGGTSKTASEQAGDVYGTHAQTKYCAPSDIAYSGSSSGGSDSHAAFGCTAKGSMPDADARVQSLFVPAHDFTSTDDAKKQNLTFSAEQGQAAMDAQKNIVSSFTPLALSKDMESTPSGKMYLTKVKALNARLSPAVHALAQIAAARSPDPNLQGYLADLWNISAASVYQHVGLGTLPEKPSDAEVMRFEVMRRYADFGTDSWHNKLIQDNDTANLLRELNTTAAVQLYVNYELHNRMEENNAILASTLAQLVSPITKADLDQSFAAVNSNKR